MSDICFFWLNDMPRMYIPHFVNRHLSYFHLLAIVNNAAMNMGVHISDQVPAFIPFRFIPGSGIDESHDNCLFCFLRSHHTVFHSNCTILHSHRESKISSFPTSSSSFPSLTCYFLFWIFFKAILMGVRWYLILLFNRQFLSTYCDPGPNWRVVRPFK